MKDFDLKAILEKITVRQVVFIIVLILLIFLTYEVLFGKVEFIRSYVASVTELDSANRELETKNAELAKLADEDFEDEKKKLTEAIEKYKTTKEEYDAIYEEYVAVDAMETASEEIVESQIKDIYDVDFLWTIIGNYATEEGVDLQFEINRSTESNSMSSMDSASNYILCDLIFTLNGSYINLTDFIYDLEDDDRLNFEINDFTMEKGGASSSSSSSSKSKAKAASTANSDDSKDSKLNVTLNVKGIKINSDNFIEKTDDASAMTDGGISTDALTSGSSTTDTQSVNSSSSTNTTTGTSTSATTSTSTN